MQPVRKHSVFCLVSRIALSIALLAAPVNDARADKDLTDSALRQLRDALENIGNVDSIQFASLLQYVRIIVANDETAVDNRKVDGRLINLLSNASSTNDYALRIQGGWLLGYLTNRYNVCGIIDTLFRPDLDLKARRNLVGIVGSQTDQMYSDVAGWLKVALNPQGSQVMDPKTAEILEAVESNNEGELSNDSDTDFKTCVSLPGIGSTYIGSAQENERFRVAIHAGKADQATIDKLAKALTERGFKVGYDRETDTFGSGIDYSIQGGDKGLALRKAAAIASIVGQSIDARVAPRPQSKLPLDEIGVWF
ncbi:hypothetical protein [Rhizobium laguerreae]|uniref:hypothetical protein n=1 Tax=Rhizobium laguerreae TaxID=1076926 RepID=UPI001C92A31A|nr:hypothetical protein [Rhizobium laguerreae]